MSPGNEEGLSAVAAAETFGGIAQQVHLDCRRPTFIPQPGTYTARLAEVVGRFASAGYELHPLQDASLVLARFGLHRVLPDLAAAERLLPLIGGQHG